MFSNLACMSVVKLSISTSVALDHAGLLGADLHTLDLGGSAPRFNVSQIGECLEKLSPLWTAPQLSTKGRSLGEIMKWSKVEKDLLSV